SEQIFATVLLCSKELCRFSGNDASQPVFPQHSYLSEGDSTHRLQRRLARAVPSASNVMSEAEIAGRVIRRTGLWHADGMCHSLPTLRHRPDQRHSAAPFQLGPGGQSSPVCNAPCGCRRQGPVSLGAALCHLEGLAVLAI